jgi:hypothetical protein
MYFALQKQFPFLKQYVLLSCPAQEGFEFIVLNTAEIRRFYRKHAGQTAFLSPGISDFLLRAIQDPVSDRRTEKLSMTRRRLDIHDPAKNGSTYESYAILIQLYSPE